jgi:hypothetical protein
MNVARPTDDLAGFVTAKRQTSNQLTYACSRRRGSADNCDRCQSAGTHDQSSANGTNGESCKQPR